MGTSATTRRSPLWHWRGNALRRREDVWEAWILLAAWLVVLVVGPVAGALSAQATVDRLAQRRAERHPATATLLSDSPRRVVGGEVTVDRAVAPVRWTAADGTSHTGRAQVDAGRQAGERVTVWLDRQDRLTAEPQSPADADIEAGFMGVASFAAVAVAAVAGVYGARVALDRRRSRAWEAEWRKLGSQWGRTAG
ncbi:Rv1733c family protein [Streptomyces massasporeus]|uniref:Rv1733c family protein n=1 Tax=Streptomyces massasporeus TaxID=67324 RepID=UPI0036BEA7C5